jgi:hypothetical protein
MKKVGTRVGTSAPRTAATRIQTTLGLHSGNYMPHDIQLPSSDVHSSNGTHQAEAARIPPSADATFTIGVAELSRFENVQVGATSPSTFWYCGDIESGLLAGARRFFRCRIRSSFDYQFVGNPGYNTDRGPANVFAGRNHTQF